MMKNFFLILILLNYCSLSAQEFVNDTNNIDRNQKWFYNTYTICNYESDKIANLFPPKDGFSFEQTIISDSVFKSLNAFEHFVHSFFYPESYHQSCSFFSNSKDILQKIPAFLKPQNDGLSMSKRQREAIVQFRDSSILLMKQCIEESNYIGDNFKSEIINLHAFELIPTILKTIEKQKEIKDPYILTMLCLLMKFDFQPFIESEIYNKLYSKNSNGYYKSYTAFIPFTTENYLKIIDFATSYYESKINKLNEFVKIIAGKYIIGEKEHTINPLKEIETQAFEISRYEITNSQFLHFVNSTGYVTISEKRKDALVFRLGLDEFEWIKDSTANWRFPNGISEGGIEDKMNHPVTCISYIDAEAYCNWSNQRLPTIEEWEIASRGGRNDSRYFFGDSVELIYEYANIWKGQTHLMLYEGEDYKTTSPVGSYKPNQFGLYDVYGNVFEFCSNIPEEFNRFDNVVATRGGSWWCSLNACGFFNSVDIGRVQKEATFSNNGFRVVR